VRTYYVKGLTSPPPLRRHPLSREERGPRHSARLGSVVWSSLRYSSCRLQVGRFQVLATQLETCEPATCNPLKQRTLRPCRDERLRPSVVPPECGSARARSPRSMPITVATGSPPPWHAGCGACDRCGASSQGAARRAIRSEGSQSAAFAPWLPCPVALVLIGAFRDKYSNFAVLRTAIIRTGAAGREDQDRG